LLCRIVLAFGHVVFRDRPAGTGLLMSRAARQWPVCTMLISMVKGNNHVTCSPGGAERDVRVS
jgi:hypothetical protein